MDLRIGDTLIEAKHGASNAEAQKRIVQQLMSFKTFGDPDTIKLVVPDEATKTLIEEHLATVADSNRAILEIQERLLDFEIVESFWR